MSPEWSFEGEFSSVGIYQPDSIAYRPVLSDGSVGSFVSARVLLSASALSNSSDFSFFISADGGTTWETVTLNANHTFGTRGEDLRIKVIGPFGGVMTLRPNDFRITYTYS